MTRERIVACPTCVPNVVMAYKQGDQCTVCGRVCSFDHLGDEGDVYINDEDGLPDYGPWRKPTVMEAMKHAIES